MKLVMPKQHGAWAMLFIPFWVSAVAGNFHWAHIGLFLAWTLLYLSSYPLSFVMKKRKIHFYLKWFFIYFISGIVLVIYPLIIHPKLFYFGISVLPFFSISLYFSKMKRDRAFTNDIIAIIIFCIGGLASFHFGAGELTKTAWIIASYTFIYFLGTVFYVKTMIREKRNPTYKYLSWIYHSLIVLIPLLLGQFLLAFTYLPSLIRAVTLYGKRVHIKKIGIVEILNSIYFFLMLLIIVL